MTRLAGFKTMRRNLLMLGLSLFAFSAAAETEIRPGFVSLKTLDPAKKTVCSITLNSDNEILEFQKQLPPNDFQFVELVDDQEKWLSRACSTGVKCDIVVVSGHFGGTFFGDKGSLELAELETNTCGQGCSGIFHDPKEVFLFGCNTLAGKSRDRRTPEQYRQVLLNDGFNRAQADQIVALRYSPMGQSFSDRMARVFAGVPRIYGFNSIGPSGDTVEPYLKDYFRRMGDYNKYINASFTNVAAEKQQGFNKTFLRALKKTAVEQVAGAARDQHNLVPMCFVRDRNIGEVPKMRWVRDTLKNPKTRLLHLAEIQVFLESPRSGASRRIEADLFADVISDQELRNDMRNMILTGLNDYPLLRFDALKIGSYFGWFSLAEVQQMHEDFLRKHLRKDMAREDVDLLCSVPKVGAYVTNDMLAGVTSRDGYVFAALSCLKPQDPRVHERVFEMSLKYFQGPRLLDIGNSLLDAMISMPIRDSNLARRILARMIESRDDYERQVFRDTLVRLPFRDEGLQQYVLEVMLKTPDEKLRSHFAHLLNQWKPDSQAIRERLVAELAKPQEDSKLQDMLRILGSTAPRDPQIHQLLMKWALDSKNPYAQVSAVFALGQAKDLKSEYLRKLLPMAYPVGSRYNLDYSVLSTIAVQSPKDPELLRDLIYVFKAQKDAIGNNKRLLLGIFESSGTRDAEIVRELLSLGRREVDEYDRAAIFRSLNKLAPEDPQIREALKAEESHRQYPD